MWWPGYKGQCPKRLKKNQVEAISSLITEPQTHTALPVVHFIHTVPLTFEWRENRLYLFMEEWQRSENTAVEQAILLLPFSANALCPAVYPVNKLGGA